MRDFARKNPSKVYYCIAFGWTWMLVSWLLLTGNANDVTRLSPVFRIGGILCNVLLGMSAFIVTEITKGKEIYDQIVEKSMRRL